MGHAECESSFWVRLWGVRGSVPCPGSSTVRYGGNTPCVEVMCAGERLIFDMGTGIRPLGKSLMGNGVREGKIFLTHTHLDHINGFPFFRPFFCDGYGMDIWAGHLSGQGMALKTVLGHLTHPTMFPIGLDALKARIAYRDFAAGDVITPSEGITLRTALLNHPGGATGYRIEHAGKTICYVTDTEHVEGKRDPVVIGLIRDADIVIYDAAFTDEEYPGYRGWGHSTWQEGVRLCQAAGAKRLVTFHHAPQHDDDTLDAVADELDREMPGSVVGREGMVLHP